MAKQKYIDLSDAAQKAAMARLLEGADKLRNNNNNNNNNNKEKSLKYSIEQKNIISREIKKKLVTSQKKIDNYLLQKNELFPKDVLNSSIIIFISSFILIVISRYVIKSLRLKNKIV